jgi:hypothetical protein
VGGLGFGGGGGGVGGPPPGAARAPVARRATRARILVSCIIAGEAGCLTELDWFALGWIALVCWMYELWDEE